MLPFIVLMKKMLLLMAVITVCYSCKKDDPNAITGDHDPVELAPLSEIKVLSPTVPIAGNPEKGAGKFNLLGYGYDVTGRFADSSAARNLAIDIAALAAEQPGRVDLSKGASGSWQLIEAGSAGEFASKIGGEFNPSPTALFFENTLTKPFGQSAWSDEYGYGYYSLRFQYKNYKFGADDSELQKYLTSAFRKDIDDLEPSALVNKYGTHVLSNIILGAKLDIVYQAKTTNVLREKAIQVGFTYALKTVFNIFNGHLDPVNQKYLASLSDQTISYQAFGGKVSDILEDRTGPTLVDIESWLSSRGQDESMLINFGNNGLLPIQNLIADPVKKSAMKAYIESYLKK